MEKLFSLDKRKADEKIEQSHCNLALAIQKVTEEVVLIWQTMQNKYVIQTIYA